MEMLMQLAEEREVPATRQAMFSGARSAAALAALIPRTPRREDKQDRRPSSAARGTAQPINDTDHGRWRGNTQQQHLSIASNASG